MKTDRIKRLISIMTVLCMIITLLPMSSKRVQAGEGPIEYDVWVGGVRVTSENSGGITGEGISGSVTYTPANGSTPQTLTVSGAAITTAYDNTYGGKAAIYAENPMNIVLLGNNSVTGVSANYYTGYGVYCSGNLNISGEGSLTASEVGGSINYGIFSTGNMTISGGTVTASSANAEFASYGIYGSKVTISGGSVSATANSNIANYVFAICGSNEGVTITGGTVTASGSGNSDKAISGALTYSNGTVMVSSNSDGSGSVNYTGESMSNCRYVRYEALPVLPVVAEIGSTGYATLQAAIDSASAASGEEIQLTANVTENITIPSDSTGNYSLDLNGFTLNGGSNVAITHNGSGTLTITDSSTGGKVTSTNGGMNSGTIYLNGGSLSVSGGTIENTSELNVVSIYNAGSGSITVYDGTVVSNDNSGFTIYNSSSGDVNVSGGSVSGYYAIWNVLNGNVNISGGVVSTTDGIAILNRGGNVNISGGTVSAITGFAVGADGSGDITITENAIVTSYSSINKSTIYLSDMTTDCILTIIGGTVSNTAPSGTAVINGGPGTISIPSGSAIIKGQGKAIYGVPVIGTNMTITASTTHTDGTETSNITRDDIDTLNEVIGYKYLRFESGTAPSISVNDPTVLEGNAGISYLTFIVTLSSISSDTITVDYNTTDGTATAGADYGAASGTLTFPPGETSKSVTVSVYSDTVVELDETVILNLSNSIHATIADNQGIGTILNDELTPTATTTAATGLTASTATLNGIVNANNTLTRVEFEYGTTSEYGRIGYITPDVISGNSDTPVSCNIIGLAPNTTYHYRVLGRNDNGTTFGADRTFTTLGFATVSAANFSVSGASGTDGTYKIGDTVQASWDNSATGDNNSGVTSVTMDFRQFGGGAAIAATNTENIWTATYTIVAGNIDEVWQNVIVTTINAAGRRTAEIVKSDKVDNIAPTVTDANISLSGGTGTGGAYKPGDTVAVSWNNTLEGDNNIDTLASVMIDFSAFGGGSAVAAANSSGTWTATYTIDASSSIGSNKNVSVTVTDDAGNTTTTTDTSNATVERAPAPGNGNSSNNDTTTQTKKEGRIDKDQKLDEKAPAVSLNNSTEELKSKLLSAEEQAQVAAGKDAKVILKIEDISASVSAEDKKKIEEKLTQGQQKATDTALLYIDISLYKKIGDEAETKVTETSGKISISIEVPESMRSTDTGAGRSYHVIRMHNGVAEVLEGTYDPTTHLFTFETDRFSTYALTYQDEKTAPDQNNAGTTDQLTVSKDFNKLRLTAKASKTSQKLTYAKIDKADGYIIYGAKCGQELKVLADVAAAVSEYTVTKLKQATYYKYQVEAYQLIDGERVIFANSKIVHSVTEGKTYANPTKVTMDVSSVSLSVGESKTVTGKVQLPKGKKWKEHTAVIRYETTNNKIATVNSKGKIKAKAQGTCYVYAYAQNGVYKKIKITVE